MNELLLISLKKYYFKSSVEKQKGERYVISYSLGAIGNQFAQQLFQFQDIKIKRFRISFHLEREKK